MTKLLWNKILEIRKYLLIGEGKTKKQAEMQSAQKALEKLEKESTN